MYALAGAQYRVAAHDRQHLYASIFEPRVEQALCVASPIIIICICAGCKQQGTCESNTSEHIDKTPGHVIRRQLGCIKQRVAYTDSGLRLSETVPVAACYEPAKQCGEGRIPLPRDPPILGDLYETD